ncbi:MAG: hypothetical protein U0L61_03650 [Alistipes sp.]|nr:hypothetical protein [Alistipes sp.]
MVEQKSQSEWLCRNCNTAVVASCDKCPMCGASRPEMVEGDDSGEVVFISKEQSAEPKRSKYIFRESVLVNAADILLILGLFCSVAALLSPAFIDDTTFANLTTLSIVAGVAIFLFSLITWALFRSVAEISRMLREQNR